MSNTLTLSAADPQANRARSTHWARGILLRQLRRLTWGRIRLYEAGRQTTLGGDHGPEVEVHIHDPAFYTTLALRGDLGAGEAYLRGDWSCDRLTDLFRILTHNLSVLIDVDSGWSRLSRPAKRLFHWLQRNTRSGSRRNIAAHYDLGNDFYRLFLDETMTYSSAIFPHPGATLAQASREKYDRICRNLALRADDYVVEVGGGWGGFAEHAVLHYGCRVTTTTISQEQHDYMRERFRQSGIADRVTVLNRDYRDLRGQFDKLVSIEMIEAVGHAYLPTFLKRCSDLLKPDGLMALQAITIADQHYRRHIHSVDFIKRYIFPGSSLISLSHLVTQATDHTDLRLRHLQDITTHYAATLRRWRQRFLARIDDVKALGFDEPFVRMWDYYLCYCEGAFLEHYTGAVQMVLTKPRFRAADGIDEPHEPTTT